MTPLVSHVRSPPVIAQGSEPPGGRVPLEADNPQQQIYDAEGPFLSATASTLTLKIGMRTRWDILGFSKGAMDTGTPMTDALFCIPRHALWT